MPKINSLLDYFTPKNYQISLSISKETKQFTGRVIITGQPEQGEARFHIKNLRIMSVETSSNQHPTWKVKPGELVIYSNDPSISIEFTGQIMEQAMTGLYLCQYQLDQIPHQLFATQFEPGYARQCFPCIDEPLAKATFDLSIQSDDQADTVVLSNMPGTKTGSTWQFETTPRMSPYLLAFVGGNLVAKSTKTRRGTTVAVYTTPAQPKELLDYALMVATKSIEFFEKYFAINYPLPKLDNVALPDFSAGAMENWGLITYRETALLCGTNTSQADKEYIATVVAHEIAHQWFGNLVTMSWWNDLWLNESFASLMQNTAIDHIFPQYHTWEDFELNEVAAALKQDSLTGTQAVQQNVASSAEIAALFDGAIVYAKGERLLKMIRSYIGEDNFRQGITHYFRLHQYRNTCADDLWRELTTVSQIDVQKLMEPWLSRPGYPIVNLSMDKGRLHLSQAEFRIDRALPAPRTWPIPLFSNYSDLPAVFDTPSLDVLAPTSQALVQLNLDDNAHFITKYDDRLLVSLSQNFTDLNNINKIKLLRESLLLSQAHLQDISHTINLLKVVKNETNQAVLATAYGLIRNLDVLVEAGSTQQDQLKSFTRDIFAEPLGKLINSPIGQLSVNDQKAWSVILTGSVYGGNDQAIAYCNEQFSKHSTSLADIEGGVRPIVLATIVKNGDQTTVNRLWEIYQTTQNAELKQDICVGLTSTKSLASARLLLSSLTDSTLVRAQDNFLFIIYLLNNPATRLLAWQWIQDNWSWIDRLFSEDMSYDTYVKAASQSLRTSAELATYDQFFAGINGPGLNRAIRVGHNEIASRIDWIKRNQPVLAKLLGDNRLG